MAGRPRKPTALKVLQGTARPDRLLKYEPMPVPAVNAAKPPASLPRLARDFWRKNARVCIEMGTLTEADLPAFTMLCKTHALYEAAYAKYLIATPMNQESAELAVHRASASLRGMLADFGMNPVGRSRISVPPKKSADPFEEWERGRASG